MTREQKEMMSTRGRTPSPSVIDRLLWDGAARRPPPLPYTGGAITTEVGGSEEGANSAASEATMLLGDVAAEGRTASATSGNFQDVSPVSLRRRHSMNRACEMSRAQGV